MLIDLHTHTYPLSWDSRLSPDELVERSKAAGLDRYMNAITSVAFDYDHDGDVDLFVGAYFAPVNLFNPETPRFFPESFETANNGGGVIAFQNNGHGGFVDVTDAIGLHTSGWTLDLGHADANNDGWDDLYVACDFGTDRFFTNTGKGAFADTTERAIGIDTKKGMNAEWGDFDNDGWLDIFATASGTPLDEVVKGIDGKPHSWHTNSGCKSRHRVYWFMHE